MICTNRLTQKALIPQAKSTKHRTNPFQKDRKTICILLILTAFIFTNSVSFAGSIKERMLTRLPTIKALKISGTVGEDSHGLLFLRDKNSSSANIVHDENSDRQKVYTAIAKKKGTTPAFVGMRRAAQIAAHAKAGDWLQDSDGNWHQK